MSFWQLSIQLPLSYIILFLFLSQLLVQSKIGHCKLSNSNNILSLSNKLLILLMHKITLYDIPKNIFLLLSKDRIITNNDDKNNIHSEFDSN